jgi:hypothetical protein
MLFHEGSTVDTELKICFPTLGPGKQDSAREMTIIIISWETNKST